MEAPAPLVEAFSGMAQGVLDASLGRCLMSSGVLKYPKKRSVSITPPLQVLRRPSNERNDTPQWAHVGTLSFFFRNLEVRQQLSATQMDDYFVVRLVCLLFRVLAK